MKKKVLIFIVTYNAQSTIEAVLRRIPVEVLSNERYQTEVLIIDDCSADKTFELSENFLSAQPEFPLKVLRNPVNLGYGGNQKVGYSYAIREGFDIVALIHGDGQYAPEKLPELLEPLLAEQTDAVFGSRMFEKQKALAGGMPLYKLLGNIVLTKTQNKIVGTKLSEYHSGYRLYSVSALNRLPFEKNSNGFDFDTDIIIQCHLAGVQIREIPIPTFYGDEICYVNGLQYAWRILLTSVVSRLQKWALFYCPKFDLFEENEHYQAKFDFLSSHSMALGALKKDSVALNLGCGGVDLVRPFAEHLSEIDLADSYINADLQQISTQALQCDLEQMEFSQFNRKCYDSVLLLDIIEHLSSPEEFLTKLRNHDACQDCAVVITTPNIAFIIQRIMLLLGFFNYGKRGILDRTHCRLFTFDSLTRLLVEQGYLIESVKGIPAPFPLALGRGKLANAFLAVNNALIFLSKRLFSFQIFVIARPNPTVETLLTRAESHSEYLRKESVGDT